MSAAAARACDYCGLPVPAPFWGAAGEPDAPDYCCFGCRFAAAVTRSRGAEGATTALLARLGLAVFLTMNVMVFSMALWTEDFYGAEGDAVGWVAPLRGVFRYLSLLFALPVLVILGQPLLDSAWQSLRRRVRTMDALLVLGVAASYAYSAVSVARDQGPIYFEVGCMVLVFVTLGRWLEARGKLQTSAALEALEQLLPEQARVLQGDGETLVPLAEIAVGDRLLVLPGERIPCDAVIIRDRAAVDEQILTGEGHPVSKGVGDRVWGGTLAVDGAILIEATAQPRGGTTWSASPGPSRSPAAPGA